MSNRQESMFWEDIQVGMDLPHITLDVTYDKVIMVPMATWDLFPGHSNPFYAAERGQKTIYLNTIVLQGFCDRVISDWSGPTTFITRRKMSMLRPVYAGDLLVGNGRVHNVYRDDLDNHKIDTSISLTTSSGLVCSADTTAIIRTRTL